jgi:hypothetical protein
MVSERELRLEKIAMLLVVGDAVGRDSWSMVID